MKNGDKGCLRCLPSAEGSPVLDLTIAHRLLDVLAGLLPMVMPLVQRGPGRPPIPDDAQSVLEHPRRREVYEMIEAHPGISGLEIKEALNMAGGVLDNHLGRLTRANLLETRRSGHSVRIYVAGHAPPEGDPILLPEMTKTVARAVLRAPGRTIAEIADEVGLSTNRTGDHLRQLAQLGLVKPSTGARLTRHEPMGALRKAVKRW